MTATKQKSQRVSQSREVEDIADVRAARTRAQIDSAFVALLHQRSYAGLRVSDIARKADVGRATFYAHFSSKDDLLRSQVVRILLPMLAVCPQQEYLLDCSRFFAHVCSAPRLYKALMAGSERSGARVIREAVEAHLEESIAKNTQHASLPVPRPLQKRFVVSTLLLVAVHGLQSGEKPEELQELFQRLVGSGLGSPRYEARSTESTLP